MGFQILNRKKDKPRSILDYRPISCGNALYKIVAKVLCNRIKDLLPHLIAENQSTFILIRNIGENILLSHAQVRDFDKYGEDKMFIEVQKSYDNRES